MTQLNLAISMWGVSQSLIQKDSVTQMHDVEVYVKDFLYRPYV